MSKEEVLSRCLLRALSGKGAHVRAPNVLEGLDWQKAGERPDGWPHSIFQVLKHLLYWQEYFLSWLEKGSKPSSPDSAEVGWPAGVRPYNEHEWNQSVSFYLEGWEKLREYAGSGDLLEPLRKTGKTTRLEVLNSAATHNSYHLGQIVVMRRILGEWPPPSGGETW